MVSPPAISVLLPTWNAMRFLPAALGSILWQTFPDFEVVIVDDASSDGTAAYLQSLRDPRLRVLRNATNLGVTASLNRGLAACLGACIARMDADDIAEPDRFSTQMEFLESHPDVGIVGSSRFLIDEEGNPIGTAPAMPDDLSIRWKCLLGNPLAHPTVMMRRQILTKHALRYDPSFGAAEDYELWTRLLPLTSAANVGKPLLRYRIASSSITRSRTAEQAASHDRIALLAIGRLLPSFRLSVVQIQNLRARYGGANVRDHTLPQSDPHWLNLLGAMLAAFADAYHDHPGIEQTVTRQAAWIASFR